MSKMKTKAASREGRGVKIVKVDFRGKARVNSAAPSAAPRKKASIADRLAKHVDRSGGEDACHPCSLSLNPGNGYPQIKVPSPKTGKPTMRTVHRVAYEAAYGPIPDGLHVLHGQGCSQRCVNVKHMGLGNRLENQQRSRSERLAKHTDTTSHPNGCHIWTASTFHDGYPKMRDISPKTGKSTMRGAHIIAYEEANGCRVPEGLHVLHGRGCDRRCVRPDHLRLGNRLENMADAKAEKRGCGVRKLSPAKAQAIIGLRDLLGWNNQKLALCFGTSPTAIRDVVSGRTLYTSPTHAPSRGGRLAQDRVAA